MDRLGDMACRPSAGLNRRATLRGLIFMAAALLCLRTAPFDAAFALTGASSPGAVPASSVESLVARHAARVSNADRLALTKARQEGRDRARTGWKPAEHVPLNWDKLPAVEDLFKRKFTGNATEDPIGGRKRYTFHVLFRDDAATKGAEQLKTIILEYMGFFKYKMSCRDISAKTRNAPDGSGSPLVQLEYPMKEYGTIPRNKKRKSLYHKAKWVTFDFQAPTDAVFYIKKKLYSDNNIVRILALGHTVNFNHLGEDNEMHL
eukprot:TRINITY_DN4440_c0_g1_i1.p1 TRINITY_DN4440_c0_g1~~TRINITY_DN4440_c0_g1_i1.p1  ORF type:complete len:262 (+),score=38.12 TRINITY_DN4440_c0_g1_i1:103-888(+)